LWGYLKNKHTEKQNTTYLMMNCTVQRTMVSKQQSTNKTSHLPTNKKDDRSGLFIPGGIFLGMGLGLLLNNLPAWLFLGMAAGFIAMALVKKN
jgi:uncharacterized ion transporter superfamily protein YfcC